jgi:hypothetical protein
MGCAPITRLALLLMLAVAATGQASAAVAADGRIGVATLVAPGGLPSASAAPLKASFQPIRSRAVSATITAARGGTLTVRAPRGMRIVVRIPSGALLADTKITATPITRFRVAPVHGGFVVGVQLAPEGLELLKPGSVEFRARKRLRPTRRYFLGSQGDGSDVHLVPPAFRKVGRGRKAKLRVVSKPVVPILHFSTVEGFDWSKTNLRDLDDIRYPQSPIDQAAQDIAKVLEFDRQGQMLGLETVMDLSTMSTVVARFRDRVLKPRLQVVTAALKNRCSLQAVQNTHEALSLALRFVRQEELLGLPVSFDKAKLIGPILTGAANCALQLCSRYGPRFSLFLFETAKQVELLAGELASKAFFGALFNNLVACSRGEVHLDSAFSDDVDGAGYSHHYTMRVVGRAPFEASPEGRWIYEEAPLEYQDVHGNGAQPFGTDCELDDTLRANSNGAFRINQLDFSQLDPTKPDTSAPIETLSLTITQDPTEYQDFSVSGSGCGDASLDPGVRNWWASDFGGLHPALPAPSFNGTEFVPEAAPVIALATYSRLGGTLFENTLVEVIAKPGPMEPLPNPI